MTTLRYPSRSTRFYNPETEMPRPVIGLDIDGTIGQYHDHFLKFAAGWFGSEMPEEPYNGSVSFYRWMGVSKTRYRQCKLAFRKGGMKRSMPIYEGAAEFSREIRKRGAVLAICTTRPFLMLDNIDPDTTEWLKRNRIQYDTIIHGEWKYRDLSKAFGAHRVIMVLEDLPELITQASEAGCDPVIIDRPHNQDAALPIWIDRVPDLERALQLALSRINNYEQREHANKIESSLLR